MLMPYHNFKMASSVETLKRLDHFLSLWEHCLYFSAIGDLKVEHGALW